MLPDKAVADYYYKVSYHLAVDCSDMPMQMNYYVDSVCRSYKPGTSITYHPVANKTLALGEETREFVVYSTVFQDTPMNPCSVKSSTVTPPAPAVFDNVCILDVLGTKSISGQPFYTRHSLWNFEAKVPQTELDLIPVRIMGERHLGDCGIKSGFLVNRACWDANGTVTRFRCNNKGMYWDTDCDELCQDCPTSVVKEGETLPFGNVCYKSTGLSVLSCTSCLLFPTPCGKVSQTTTIKQNVQFDNSGLTVESGGTVDVLGVVELNGTLLIILESAESQTYVPLNYSGYSGQFADVQVEVPSDTPSCTVTTAVTSYDSYGVTVVVDVNKDGCQSALPLILGASFGGAVVVALVAILTYSYCVRRKRDQWTADQNQKLRQRELQDITQRTAAQ